MKGLEREGEITWQDRETRSLGGELVMAFHGALPGTAPSLYCLLRPGHQTANQWAHRWHTETTAPCLLKMIPILLSHYTILTWHYKDNRKPRSVNSKTYQSYQEGHFNMKCRPTWKAKIENWQQIKIGRNIYDFRVGPRVLRYLSKGRLHCSTDS